MACECCPFAFTDASEEVQNYGCLPTPYDIIQMKRESGHNWSCHNNEKVICQGFKDHVKEAQENNWLDNLSDIDTSAGGLISYDTWYQEGEEAAIQKAGEKEGSGVEKYEYIGAAAVISELLYFALNED